MTEMLKEMPFKYSVEIPLKPHSAWHKPIEEMDRDELDYWQYILCMSEGLGGMPEDVLRRRIYGSDDESSR